MTETTAGSDHGVRASDAEREETVAALHTALGEGRLDLPETETRLAAAYGARYRHELPVLLSDLPVPPASIRADEGRPPSWHALWAGLVWRVRSAAWDGPAGGTAPGATQRRIAAVIGVVTLLWFSLFVLVGALTA